MLNSMFRCDTFTISIFSSFGGLFFLFYDCLFDITRWMAKNKELFLMLFLVCQLCIETLQKINILLFEPFEWHFRDSKKKCIKRKTLQRGIIDWVKKKSFKEYMSMFIQVGEVYGTFFVVHMVIWKILGKGVLLSGLVILELNTS